MTPAPDTLANIGLAFPGELTERENCFRAELTQSLGKIADLITSGFQFMNTRIGQLENRISGIEGNIEKLQASDRELLQAVINLQGQVTGSIAA
jgi:hypothetical protein